MAEEAPVLLSVAKGSDAIVSGSLFAFSLFCHRAYIFADVNNVANTSNTH